MNIVRGLRKGLGLALVLAGMSSSAWAVDIAPELDPGSMMSAIALISGGLMVLTGKRRAK